MNKDRQLIIDTYLKTIGKTWEEITAFERATLGSFADELIQQWYKISDPRHSSSEELDDIFKRHNMGVPCRVDVEWAKVDILKHFISIESVREACRLESVSEFSSIASESIEPMFRNRAKSQILQTLGLEEEL